MSSNDVVWDYHNPVQVVNASLEALPQYVAGKHVLLVTSNGFVSRGVVDRIRQILTPRKLTVWDSVKPNPDLQALDIATTQLRHQSIDGVIGLGGGSVLDTAKVLATTLPSLEHPTLEQVFRCKVPTHWIKRLPLVAIPTTAGTGSEVTPFATVWDLDKHEKHSLAGNTVYPDVAFLDASLTLTLSEKDTLYPALDAISHALESLWNKNISPVTQAFAIQSLSLANWALPEILNSLNSLHSRQAMQVSSTLAGLAISQTKTAIAHSISYPLTSHLGVPHGLACSFTLPRLISHFLECEPATPFAYFMRNTQDLLESLELDKRITEYADEATICALANRMITPGRADNFSVCIPGLMTILRS